MIHRPPLRREVSGLTAVEPAAFAPDTINPPAQRRAASGSRGFLDLSAADL